MRFGSLFSGIGGFDLGFERAGMSCAWQCEIDDKARAVLERHWPNAKGYRHVESINYRTGKAWRRYPKPEPVDLICGGFPCQDLSVAGKRAGLAGERSGLWFEFRRILEQSRPGWVVIENVPGLLSSNGGRDFAVVLRGLVELGYGVAWRVLDAQYFGVAQRRRRVFIVGSLNSGRAAEVLFEREGGPGDTAPRRETGQDFAPLAGTLSANRGGLDRPAGNANELDFCIPVAATLRGASDSPAAHGKQNGTDRETLIPAAIAWTERTRGKERNFEYQEEVAYALTNPGSGGRPHSRMIAHALTANYGKQVDSSDTNQGPPNVIVAPMAITENGRQELRLTEYNNALSTGGGKPGTGYPAALTGMGVRRLMPVECERLQSFPDGWTDNQADSARYRQLGNAVCVNVATWIGQRILAVTP